MLGFCLHFHYIPTILSDAYILSPISWLGFNLLTHSAHSPHCPEPHRESERGYITAHESRRNEMHSRRFQMVLIYGRGLRIQKNALNVIWSLYSMLNLWAIVLCLAEWLILKIDGVIDYRSLTLKYVDNSINNKISIIFYSYSVSRVKGKVVQQWFTLKLKETSPTSFSVGSKKVLRDFNLLNLLSKSATSQKKG